LATGVPASGVRSTRSLHEHTNAIELAWKHITIVAHPRVRTSPEVGPGATVGTPGLGYPLLLCLGKSLVVIFDYVQTAGPLRSGALFTRQRSRTRPPAGEGLGAPRVPEEAAAQPEQPGPPDLPWRSGPPRSPGPPMGSRTPCIVTRPLTKG